MNQLNEDHGAFTGDTDKAVKFLYHNNIIAFVIFIIAIITSQFWFEFFHQILREVTGLPEPRWYQMLVAALFWTIIFMLAFIIFKVPVAASFTL